MDSLISRQAAIDALANLDQYAEVGECLDAIKGLPPTQPDDEETNYWHEKANSYEQTLIKLSQNIAKQPERKKGRWTDNNACQFCGFQPWYERDIHTLSYCPNCGADMKGE